MARVLLINPPVKNIVGLELPLFVRQNEGAFPPLGLMYIASYLKKNLDCEVKILDTIAEKMDYGEIEGYIRDFHPFVVGITAHTHSLIDVILVANIVKKVDRQIHISLGGAHVNAFPYEAIGIASIDSVVLGDGEITFAELVEGIKQRADLRRIKGLIFKEDYEYVNTGLREGIENLDSLSFPERSLLDCKKYYSILGRKAIMTTMVSSRGCPYQCTFCSTPKGFYRMRSPENVVDEMAECIKLGLREIHFVDDTFNVYPDRVTRMCDEIKERELRVRWSFRGRVDNLTKSLLIKVKEAGCYRVHLGVEASTDEGLKLLKKGIIIEQIKQVFRWTRDIKLDTVAYFLIGCSHEKSREDVINTINFSKEIDPDFALFNILTPYPSTELYEEGLRRGILRSDCWREFVLNPRGDFKPELWQEWLSREELFSLLNLAYRKFYLRPRPILRILNSPKNLRILSRRFKIGIEIFKFYFTNRNEAVDE